MHGLVVAGAGFLMAVLWFDLMFDAQVRNHAGVLSDKVLASISGYYRRVTIEAWPMNRFIALVMIVTVFAIIAEIVRTDYRWSGWISLAAAASAIGLDRVRTIPDAMRLGRAQDSAEIQSKLARTIFGDHIYCLAAISIVLVLQLV